MKAIAYLQFGGNAAKALEFYRTALNADSVKKVRFKDFGQDPNYPRPEEEQDMIMEADLTFSGNRIMLSDVPPSMQAFTGNVKIGNNILISLIDMDKETLERYFNNLSVDGTVIMPLSETPWSGCFGLLIDKFGISWKFNGEATQFLDKLLRSANSSKESGR